MRIDSYVLFDAAIGFNVETVQYNNIKFQVWDLGMETILKDCYFPYKLVMFILSVLVLKVRYSKLFILCQFGFEKLSRFVLVSFSNSHCFFHDTGGQTSIRYLLFTWCYFLFLFCLGHTWTPSGWVHSFVSCVPVLCCASFVFCRVIVHW